MFFWGDFDVDGREIHIMCRPSDIGPYPLRGDLGFCCVPSEISEIDPPPLGGGGFFVVIGGVLVGDGCFGPLGDWNISPSMVIEDFVLRLGYRR